MSIKGQGVEFVKGWRLLAKLQLIVNSLFQQYKDVLLDQLEILNDFLVLTYLIYTFYVFHLQWFSFIILIIHSCNALTSFIDELTVYFPVSCVCILLLKTLTCLNFHVKWTHWITENIDSISPMFTYWYYFQPTLIINKVFPK